MRILITATTAVLAASAAVAGSGGDGGVAGGQPPCRPSPAATVWTWPLPTAAAPPGRSGQGPPLLRGFEPPPHRWDAGHRGVDLEGPAGAAVVAAGAGTVLFAGRIAGQGVVVVGHGALRTSYEPVEADVSAGALVVEGQRIGTLEAGHCAGAACLHWGLLAGHGHATVYYDPLLLLGCGGVRLEPVQGE